VPTPTTLKIFDVEYTVEDDVPGVDGESAVIHLFGRDVEGIHCHVEVTGFTPYFCVPTEELRQQAEALANDSRITGVQHGEQSFDPDDPPLSKIETRLPKHVGELRGGFENPFEGDVLYPNRFLVDKEIVQCCQIDAPVDERVSAEDVQGVEDTDVANIPPRVCTIDIEVQQGGDGPSVISESGIEQARNAITAITLHDSYTDEYVVFVLEHDEWDHERRLGTDVDVAAVNTYSEERHLLQAVCENIGNMRPDVFTAWNVGFDAPYLVNRCMGMDLPAVYELSPLGRVYEMNGDGNFIDSSIKGMIIMDLIKMFKKTEFRDNESYTLRHIANEVLDEVGKLDVQDIDEVWKSDPEQFVRYNKIDVEAAVGINETRKIL